MVLLCWPVSLAAQTLTLTWSDNSTNETGFAVERSTDGASFGEIARIAANVESYVDAGLEPATDYFYRVRAFNAAGFSGYTNTARGTTAPLDPPASPDKAERIRERLKRPDRGRTLPFLFSR